MRGERLKSLTGSGFKMIAVALALALMAVSISSLRSPPVALADDDLQITGIETLSTPSLKGTYGLGETIEFAVDFTQEVEVRGYVVMGLWVGDKWRGATYQRGSGSDQLVFGYEVQPDDSDTDGYKVHDGYVDSDGTRHGIGGSGVIIEPNSGARVSPWYDGIDDQVSHKVDGSRVPRPIEYCLNKPVDGDTFRAGEKVVLDLVFSAPVRALNTPYASLWFDGTGGSQWKGAKYESGSGTNTLRFSYEVQPGDLDTDGLLVGAKDARGLGEGKVKALNHDVDAIHTYGEWRPGFNVNGRPYVRDVEIVSSPAHGDGIYGQGEYVTVAVTFDQEVEKGGELKMGLVFDGGADQFRYAPYDSGDGTDTFFFKYEVAIEDYDTDGMTIVSEHGDLFFGEGNIKAKGTDVELYSMHFGLLDVEGHEVNGGSLVHDKSAPKINSVSIVSDPGDDATYATGEQIVVAVTFNEPVSVSGAPQIVLGIGSDEKTAQFRDRSSVRGETKRMGAEPTVLLGYVVQEGDLDSDGISIEADRLSLNEGTIWDKIGNHAGLTHKAVKADSGHKVEALDITGPIVNSVVSSSNPGGDGQYGIGDVIEVMVTFSEDVTVTGTPQLELEVGDTASTASHLGHDGPRMTFAYVVAEGDDAPHGIAIPAESLNLGGGTIEDGAGNPADLAHEAIAADDSHRVDGVRPAFDSAEVSEDGEQVAVNFSEAVALSSLLGKLGDAIDVSDEAFLRAFVSLTVGGEDVIASDAELSGSTLYLSLGTEINEDQEITVTYGSILAEEGVPIFVDGAGNAMNSFDSQPVDNLSTVPDVSAEDTYRVLLSETLLELDEGESVTYTVVLSSQPSEDVLVNITRFPHAPLSLPFLTMTFTPENWNEPLSVTLEAESDDDELSHLTFLNHTAHGGGYYLETTELRVVISDDDS